MKARITRARELALLYRLPASSEKGAAVRRALDRLGLEARDVPVSRLSWTLSALCEPPGLSPEPESGNSAESVPDQEALVMAGLSKARLEQLLDGLRREGAGVPLKAVLTEHNRHWTFAKLLAELSREDELMRLAAPVQRDLRRAQELRANLPAEKAAALDEAASLAVRLLSGDAPPEPDRLRAAARRLEAALKDAQLSALL